ncbi:MAG: imidazolonepropionase [Deltaproteobacteria bacterium]|nr:imidazolonepropionase [Deltaproteobacteria bacterium]
MRRSLFYNISSLVPVASNHERRKVGRQMQDLSESHDAYLVVENCLITDLGKMSESPPRSGFDEVVDCSSRLVLPGFVDSHTHLLYAGDRSDEFEMRAKGMTYQEIARAGGGIKKSVRQVREATEKQLIEETLPRLKEMLSHGTTTVEIKSGYGLSVESELKMLRSIRSLREKTPLEIHATFLGAHDVPAGVTRKTYIREICEEMIPQVVKEGLAEFCDVFCDEGYFTPEETRKIAIIAKEHGLKLRIHANELGNSGGAEVAAELNAVSADHLLFLEKTQIEALKEKNVICTLLPGTSFFLKLPYAPARKLIDEGLTVALATDANPGSCTALSMNLIQNMATTQLGMSPSEALVASTLHGAASLCVADRLGSLEIGKQADFIVTRPMNHFREISYGLGQNPCWRVYKGGRLVAEN